MQALVHIFQMPQDPSVINEYEISSDLNFAAIATYVPKAVYKNIDNCYNYLWKLYMHIMMSYLKVPSGVL